MKKRLVCLVLIVVLCLSFGGTALAAEKIEIIPYGAVGLSSGLTHVSGTSYRPWASATAVLPENITVGFTLYKIVNGSEVFVTSGSASANSTFVKSEKTVTLSSGSYKLYAWYIGQTQSDGVWKTYSI